MDRLAMTGFAADEPEFCVVHGYTHMRKRDYRDRVPYCAACENEATCNHWPGQKRCGVCGMGSKLVAKLVDATRQLEDSNDILARLIDAEAQVERLRRKLEEIHSITQDTTPRIECWEKLQNIAATASSALALGEGAA